MESKCIVIISNEPWGPVWYSKQHYANELSLLGYTVYFVNNSPEWRIRNLFSFSAKVTLEQDNLYSVHYKNNLPHRVFRVLNDWINHIKISRLLPKNKAQIWWQFDCQRFVNIPKKSDKVKRIYHVADPYMSIKTDKVVAKNADLIVCTSPKYKSYYQPLNNNVIVVQHGVSSEEFNVDEEKINNLQKKYGAYFILTGTLNDTVSLEIIEKTLNIISPFKLLILGPNFFTLNHKKKKFEQLNLSHTNLEYLGSVNGTLLKNYIAGSKGCLVCYEFDLIKAIGAGSPLKILNYIAQQKPTITTIDSELPELNNEGVYYAPNMEEYEKLLNLSLNNDLRVNKKEVLKFLKNRTYPLLIDKIFKSII